MKYILLFLIFVSYGVCGELKIMTDSYVNDATPTISYERNNKFIGLLEMENPYVDGTIDKNSILYTIIQQDKKSIELGIFRSSRSDYLDSKQLDEIYENPTPFEPTGGVGWFYDLNENKKFKCCSKAPEPSTNCLLLIGLSSLFFIRRNK